MSEKEPQKATILPYGTAIKKQFSNELQWHSDFSIFFILQGTINLNLNNRGHLLNQNDIYFMKPFDTFSIIAASSDARVFHLTIRTSFIKELVPDFDSIQYTTHYIRHNISSQEHLALSRHIGQIVLHGIKEGSCERLKCISAAANIMTILIESYGNKDSTPSSNAGYAQERVREIITYINENYHNKIMLEDISGYLGIHPQYFSTFFKKRFNQSFIEFLTVYRLYRSVSQLLAGSDSILDIAVAHGFNNHKTYSTAFRELFYQTPTQYRVSHKQTHDWEDSESNPQNGIFYFFQQFWNQTSETDVRKGNVQRHQSLNINFLEKKPDVLKNDRPLFIDAGRASSCLRSEIQEQIRVAKMDLDFNYLRLRDIFSDDLFVYHEEADKVPVFNWQYIDIILDFLIAIKLKPLIELGFMPRHLASKKQYAGWNFHPNVSYPKSIEKWAMLISGFMYHCISRYGLVEVRSWYFDFWICPDLSINQGYWNETMDKFFEFYHASYDAVKTVDKQIKIGSPNFSMPSGIDWYESFFLYCHGQKIKPDFVSMHLYGTDLKVGNKDFLSYSNSEERLTPLPDKSFIATQIQSMQRLMDRNGFGQLKIIVSNWNVSFYPRDLTRDTSFMAPYFAYIQTSTLKHAYGMCFRSLSDVNEEFFPYSTLFHGGTGMVDFYGLKKAVYHAFYFYTKLGRHVLEISDSHIVTQSERGYQIMLFNLSFYDSLYRLSDRSALSYEQRYNIYEATEDLNIHMLLSMLPGKYSIKKSMVNRHSGSAYDIWLSMGAPEILDASLVNYIRNKSIPEVIFYTEEVSSSLIIDTRVEPHEVILLEIERTLENRAAR